ALPIWRRLPAADGLSHLVVVLRQAGGGQPVEREGARVADHVATAHLQLRRDADRDRRDRALRPPGGGQGCLKRRSEEHTSELQSRENLVCRLLLEKKN